MTDSINDRMKQNYEDRSQTYLLRRTYNIVRLDGKSFTNYTKDLNRPYDNDFVNDMNQTAKTLCEKIEGAVFAEVHSDEISILLTDFQNYNTCLWYNGNIQKICSVSASIATAEFNRFRIQRELVKFYNEPALRLDNFKLANFDSRCFTIPAKEEVINYFISRQQDCTRNSISSVARSLYSHKELEGKNSKALQELIFQKGQNWNDLSAGLKRGRFVIKRQFDEAFGMRWTIEEPPILSQDRDYLYSVLTNLEAAAESSVVND